MKSDEHLLQKHFPQLQQGLALALCFFLNVANAVAAKGSVLRLEVKDAIQHRSAFRESQDQVHEDIADVAEMLYPLIKMLAEVQQKQNEIVIGLMTGRIRIQEKGQENILVKERKGSALNGIKLRPFFRVNAPRADPKPHLT